MRHFGDGRRKPFRTVPNRDAVRKAPADKPSLAEQLFPNRYGQPSSPSPDIVVPKVPVEAPAPIPLSQQRFQETVANPVPAVEGLESSRLARMRRQFDDLGEQTALLILRGVSKNLVEDDFRRLAPKGKHLEGWNLKHGNLLYAFQGRDYATLSPQDRYYIVFSSPRSAFEYLGHARKVHAMAKSQTPDSPTSPMLPPSGYKMGGMDVDAAIESYTLAPATQKLELIHPERPYAPLLHAALCCKGVRAMVNPSDRMPFEARFTMEGPQLSLSSLRELFRLVARDRGLAWTATDSNVPVLTKWERFWIGPVPRLEDRRNRRSSDWANWFEHRDENSTGPIDSRRTGEQHQAEPQDSSTLLHPGPSVFIVGFPTERSLQSFVHFWHLRPLALESKKASTDREANDVPPVAHVDILW